MRVKDAVVVVTGASSGIGRATALRFAREGADLVLAARDRDGLEAVAEACRGEGVEAMVVPTDVTDEKAVGLLARRTAERFGRIDVWVNDAAVTLFSPFADTPVAEFRRVIDVNVMGYVHGARAALPYLRDQGRGVLVNVSSVLSAVPQPYTHAYVMSKAAVRALGSSLRQELDLEGFRDVHVCTVMPATIDTPIFQHAANHTGRRPLAMPPVYPAERVARAVVNLVRVPRREVVVGSAGRLLLLQGALAPGFSEWLMARQVDRTHLSRTDSAEQTSGTLFTPQDTSGSVDGGWNGRRRSATRRLATAALLTAGTAAAVASARRWR